MAKRAQKRKRRSQGAPDPWPAISAASPPQTPPPGKFSDEPRSVTEPPREGTGESRLPSETTRLSGATLGRAALIVAAAIWVFWPVLRGDWLWDDPELVTQNQLVQSDDGLWKIWFEPLSMVDFQPIKFTVSWLEWHLWGRDTTGYHLVNLALHITSALLVWRLLARFRLRGAWLGGLLFAVHPMTVESVAWIAELKNTLALPPFLLAMICYVDYEEKRRPRDYALAFAWFFAAMLCKASMVMFPAVILLYGWWERGRIGGRDLRNSAPFFALSLGIGVATIWFLEHHSEDAPVPLGGFFARLACAGLAIGFYFGKSFWPVGLLPVYLLWKVDPPTALEFVPWLCIAGALYWLWRRRAGWGRPALLGVGFFLINLLPFVGFNAGSYMRFTWVMDHVNYLPILGLIGLVAAGWGDVMERLRPGLQIGAAALTGAVVGLLAWESHGYASRFFNQETLWTYAMERQPEMWIPHVNLGAWLQLVDLPAAIAQDEEAIRLYPRSVEANINLGSALDAAGRVPEALVRDEIAVRLAPQNPGAHNNLGNVLNKEGRTDEALQELQKAAELDPNYPDPHMTMGAIWEKRGRLDEAMASFAKALELQPNSARARNNLGVVWEKKGNAPEALAQYREAVALDGANAEARMNLGRLLFLTGQQEEGLEELQQAVSLNPGNPEARDLLGIDLGKAGRVAEALAQFEATLKIDPQDARAHCDRGVALERLGRGADALAEYQAAVQLSPGAIDPREDLGVLLGEEGRLPEAAAQFQMILKLDPNHVMAHRNLGVAYAKMGRRAEALKELETAQRLAPQDPTIQSFLATLKHAKPAK
jgi:tetratricopeptide (TPR) repeat protein